MIMLHHLSNETKAAEYYTYARVTTWLMLACLFDYIR